MKLSPNYSSSRTPAWATTVQAFTLTELMVTMAIFALVVMAMVSLQIFGFKMNAFTSNKLISTANSLKVLNQIQNQIKGTPNPVFIGNFNTGNNTFTAIANGQPANGNAVQVSNGPTSILTFYLNTSTHILYELTITNTSTNNNILAKSVINPQPFSAENCFGNTNIVGGAGHYSIQTTLQYSNWLFSMPTQMYDAYRLETLATPRSQ
jgi:prepilin-type N-terminal cleavage/methylation domain-containing protein